MAEPIRQGLVLQVRGTIESQGIVVSDHNRWAIDTSPPTAAAAAAAGDSTNHTAAETVAETAGITPTARLPPLEIRVSRMAMGGAMEGLRTGLHHLQIADTPPPPATAKVAATANGTQVKATVMTHMAPRVGVDTHLDTVGPPARGQAGHTLATMQAHHPVLETAPVPQCHLAHRSRQ